MKHGKAMIAGLAAVGLWAGMARAESSATPFEMGVKVGVNIAKVTGTGNSTAGSVTVTSARTTGLVGGIFMAIGSGSFAFAPELLFTAKGYTYSSAPGATALTVVDHFNYIEVPVLFRLLLVTSGPIRPYLAAGPAVSFLMSAKSKADLAGATTTTDVKSALSSYDYSAVGDAGLAVSIGIGTLCADFRYDLGLADISKASGINTKNSVISILAGFSW